MPSGLSNASIKVALEGDPKGFNAAAKSAQKQVRNLQGAFDASNTEAVSFLKNVEQLGKVKGFAELTAKLKKNQVALAEQKARARALGAEYRRTGDALAKFGAEASKDRIKGLSRDIRDQTAALRGESAALRAVGVDTGNLAGEQVRLVSAIDRQSKEWDDLKNKRKQAAEDSRRLAAEEAGRSRLAAGQARALAIAEDQRKKSVAEAARRLAIVEDGRRRLAAGRLRSLAIAEDQRRRVAAEAARRLAIVEDGRRRLAAGQQVRQARELQLVQAAWGTVGTRSARAVREEIVRVAVAVRDLRSRGLLDERGIESARRTTARLRAELRGVSNEQRRVGLSVGQSLRGLDGLLGGLRSKWSMLFSGVSVVTLTRQIFDAGRAAQSLDSSFKVIFGSSRAAGKELEFVRNVSKDLGLNFRIVAKDYQQLSAASRGTVLEGREIREIFLGVAQASTVLGLSADQTHGALKAIEQMISKGKVQAEELRGQLGERLPGAFQMAADAIGVTTAELDKMLKAGEVTAEMLLPKLADILQNKFAAGAKAASQNATQALNRLQNAWYNFRVELAQSGFLDFATEKINDLSAALDDPAVRAAAVELMQSFLGVAEVVSKFIVNYGALTAKVGGSLIALSLLNKAVLTLITAWGGLNQVILLTTGLRIIPFLRTFGSVVGGLVGTVAGLSTALAGLAAVWGTVKIYQAVQAFGEMRQAQDMAAQAVDNNAKQQEKFQKTLEKISEESGVTVTSYEEMREAFASGAIAYDEATDTYSKGSGKIVEAAKAAAKAVSVWKKMEGKELKEAQKQWKEYADERKKVLDQINEIGVTPTGQRDVLPMEGLRQQAGVWSNIKTEASAAAQSTGEYGLGISEAADELFKLSLAGKSDEQQRNSRLKAANEYAAAMRVAAAEAKKLAIAGDIEGANQKFAESVKIGEKWKATLKASATEVKVDWTPAMEDGLSRAKEAAKNFGKEYTEAMKASREAGDDLEKTTKSLADAEKGLADAQRDIARDGMTAAQVYQDISSEQRELERASKAAAKAGNYDLAISKAKEARQVASELNKEVREGEQVVVSAEEAKRNASDAEVRARQLEISALKAKQDFEKKAVVESEKAAAKALAAKEAEIEKTKNLEEEKQRILVTAAEASRVAAEGIAKANQEIVDILDKQKTALESVADSLNITAGGGLGEYFSEAGKEAEALGTLAEASAGQLQESYKVALDETIAKVQDLSSQLDDAARDRTATITVKEIQARADGGLVQGFAGGGSPALRRLSSRYITGGAGKVDGFGPVKLDYHEYVLQRKAVHDPRLRGDGLRLASAHNRGDLAGMQFLLSKHLGQPAITVDLPSAERVMSGQRQGRRADPHGGGRTLVFADPVTHKQATVQGQPMDLAALEEMIRVRELVRGK